MVAVASRVESDVAGEPWRAPAIAAPRRVVVSSSLAEPVRAGASSGPLPAPLPLVRAVAGPHVRLPASTYRRRRAVAAGLVVGLVLVVWASLGVFGGGPLLAPERPDGGARRLVAGETYVVQPGDTFWSIAVRLRPDGDPRPLVDRLVASHGGRATLHVGEHLRLPV